MARTVHPFVLAEENKRVDQLLAAAAEARQRKSTDDETTLDAPAPTPPPELMSPAPDERRLALMTPLAAPSPLRQTMAQPIPLAPPPNVHTQRWIVAGIWATALGLGAALWFMACSR